MVNRIRFDELVLCFRAEDHCLDALWRDTEFQVSGSIGDTLSGESPDLGETGLEPRVEVRGFVNFELFDLAVGIRKGNDRSAFSRLVNDGEQFPAEWFNVQVEQLELLREG